MLTPTRRIDYFAAGDTNVGFTPTMLSELPGVLHSLMVQPEYKTGASTALSRLDDGYKLSKQYVDDAKLTDHHAIIPTNIRSTSLSGKQKHIYDLITRRFIAIFLASQVKAERGRFRKRRI